MKVWVIVDRETKKLRLDRYGTPLIELTRKKAIETKDNFVCDDFYNLSIKRMELKEPKP